MAINIGSAALQLGANIGPLQSGLGSALQSVQSFSTGTRIALAEATAGMSELLGLITKIIAVISSAAIVAKIQETAQAIKETNEEAKALGLSFNFVASLQSAGIENASQAFRKVSQQIQKAMEGNVQSIAHLQTIGVEPARLVAMGEEQRIQTVIQALAKMPAGVERTTLATQMLGRNWQQLIAKVGDGEDAFAKMKAEADRFGTTLGPEQLERIEQMNNSWRQLKESIKGMWTQLTAAVAPFFATVYGGIARIIQAIRMVVQPVLTLVGHIGGLIQSVASWIYGLIDGIMDWFNSLGAVVMPIIQGIKSFFVACWNAILSAIENVGKGFGYVVDGIKIGIGLILDTAIAPLLRGFSAIIESIMSMLEALSEIPGVGDLIGRAAGALGRFRDNVRDTANSLTEAGRAMRNTRMGESAEAVGRFFNRLREGRGEVAEGAEAEAATITNAVNTAIGQLNQQFRHFQRTREEIMMADIRNAPGFVDNRGNREQLQRLQQTMDRNMAQTLTAQVDPTIQLATELERLSGLFQRGALSAQAFAMQNQRVLQQAERALGLGKEFKAEQAIQKGTTQAFEVVARFQMADRGAQTVEQRREAVQNQMRRLSERQVQIQEQMLRALNPAAVPVVL